MSTRPSKKHKRSGSVTTGPPASSPKKSLKKRGALSHSKFQKSASAKEYKYFDTDLSATYSGANSVPVLGSAVAQCLNLYQAGTGSVNTLGRRVVNTSVQIRGHFYVDFGSLATGTTSGPCPVRALLVYDRASNGAVSTAANIVTGPGSSAFMALQNSDRFTILMDEKFVLGAAGFVTASGYGWSGDGSYYMDRYVKCRLESVAAANFTGAVGAVTVGTFLLVMWTENGTVKVTSLNTRVRFVDG